LPQDDLDTNRFCRGCLVVIDRNNLSSHWLEQDQRLLWKMVPSRLLGRLQCGGICQLVLQSHYHRARVDIWHPDMATVFFDSIDQSHLDLGQQ
jgi:hypothetical protein